MPFLRAAAIIARLFSKLLQKKKKKKNSFVYFLTNQNWADTNNLAAAGASKFDIKSKQTQY